MAADAGSRQTRVVERLVGSPTPLGPALLLSDQAAWRVDVPEGAVVLVDASADANSPFYLRVHRLGEPDPSVAFPASRQSFLIPSAGAWRVVVDPAGGAVVKIVVTFQGSVADVGGGPASFALTELGRDHACVVPGVCLP